MIYPANLLITNYCNQSCPFCFASREMSSTTLDKEMKIEDFKKILIKVTHNRHSNIIKLLFIMHGNEATINLKFYINQNHQN